MKFAYSVASPIKECKKSALPNVPVTSGGACPLGVSMSTESPVSACISPDAELLTVVADMTEDLLMTHLPQRNFTPIAVG